MSLAEQWRELEGRLPSGWSQARVRLNVAHAGRCERAAALLGPLTPVRRGTQISFSTARHGTAPGPEAVLRLVRRLDADGIEGELELLSAEEAAPVPAAAPVVARRSLAEAWDEALAALPPDWSDVYAEVELTSSDHLDQAALLMSPLNPTRFGARPTLRFRVARSFGYGASPGLGRRCLERLDEAGIRGQPRILRALADTRPVATQGPVWYVGGRAV